MMMIAALSVALVLLLGTGALVCGVRTRRSFAKLPHAFKCKVVVNQRRQLQGGPDWPRWPCHAVWVHDSLVLVSGLFRITVRPLLVRFVEGAIEDAPLTVIRGLGRRPILLSLELDDESHALLAAPGSARPVVAGPYFVALLTPKGGPEGSASVEKQPPGTK